MAVLLLANAPSLLAQYDPPAKDLHDLQKLVASHQGLAKPALAGAEWQARALHVLASAHRALDGEGTMARLSDAERLVDDAIERIERSDEPVPRDVMQRLYAVRAMFGDVRRGPAPSSLEPLRERLHHEFIHPLARLVLANVRQLEQIASQYAALAQMIRGTSSLSLDAAQGSVGQ